MKKTNSLRSWVFCCASVLAATAGAPAFAQEETSLGDLVVTAQRRSENIQKVPVSVSTLDAEKLESLLEGGDDIRALATRVPSLYAESSNGRLAPRFYIRGLGNSDFDLAASQPVSIIVDEVVLENVILKSFPLFDIERVEVLRGPQGTLFGRNTPAGIVKFDTRKPAAGFEANVGASYGELGTMNVQAAVGGGSEVISGRIAVMYQERDDWIDNNGDPTDPGDDQADAMGGFDEFAYRAQLQIEPSDAFRALLNVHGRDIDGTASIFRANVLGIGSDGFNANFDRDSVNYDGGGGNPQSAQSTGGSVRLDFNLGEKVTLISVSAYETTESSSLGDIDGGFGADFLGNSAPCPPNAQPGDACIPFPSDTQDGIDDLDQFTQEFRVAGQATEQLFWQAGAFYFDSDFTVTTNPFFVPATTVRHENQAWAVFGHMSYQITDALTMTGGLRWTDDEKDFSVESTPFGAVAPRNVSDSQVSWDLSAMLAVNDNMNLYGRLASGFRAPTIQGRDVAFGGQPSVADSETIDSVEAGFKSLLAGNRVRLNGSVFYYEIKDQQLSAIGGGGNFVQLVNADKGTGFGFDVDGEFLVTDNFLVTVGLSWVDTELKDNTLTIFPCGASPATATAPHCTVRDPMPTPFTAQIDGNPFTQAPEYIATFTARYGIPLGSGELFFSTDWAFQGDTEFFLYQSEEFHSGDTFEGGARVGFSFNDGQYEVALFGRNITDEENVKGGIDFNNLTGFDNEPRIVGVSFRANFH